MLYKKLLITILVIFTFANIRAQDQKYLISYDSLAVYEAADFNGLVPLLIAQVFPDGDFPIEADSMLNVINPQFNIMMYRVAYNCEHPVHGLIQATAAVAIPQNMPCSMPLAVYQHGTTTKWDDVPSYQSQEHLLGALFSVSGYVTLMPDYLGLGDSEFMHPYTHSQSTANAGRDLIRAVREMQDEVGFELNDEIVITGYSQGGHGAMALFKSLEEDHSDEFTVSACSPLSGPYQISGAQEDVMWKPYGFPHYLPYVIEGYRSVYPDLASEFDAIYTDEYADFNNFDGNSEAFFEILNQYDLPEIPIDIIKESFREAYQNDDNHPLKVAMRDNDNYDWNPKAPLLIQGCCDDEQVTIENANIAFNTMTENGVEKVELVNYCDEYPEIDFLGHGECIPFCLVAGKAFFDSHTTRCEPVSVDENIIDKSLGVQLYPNPAVSDFVTLQSEEFTNKAIEVELYNAQGQMVWNTQVDHFPGNIEVPVSSYHNGFYSFIIRSNKTAYGIPFIVQQ